MIQELPEKISSIDEIKKKSKKEEIVSFPSGFKAKLRKVRFSEMVEKGFVSNELLSAATGKEEQKFKTEEFKKLIKTINEVVLICFIEPKVVREADKGQLALNDLSDEDKFFAFNWAMPTMPKEEVSQKKNS